MAVPESDSGELIVPPPEGLEAPAHPRNWTAIVLHHSATPTGNAARFHKWHLKKGWDGLGYHFVIDNGQGGPDGKIETGWRWTAQRAGAHAGDTHYNKQGVGICLVGNFENTRPSDKQYQSLLELCRWLMQQYGIGVEGLKLHKQVRSRGPTACPGKNFPLARLKQDLGG